MSSPPGKVTAAKTPAKTLAEPQEASHGANRVILFVVALLVAVSAYSLQSFDLIPSLGGGQDKATAFVSAKSITYKGTARGGVEHFKGVFYAGDTSGKNRFAPPVPFSPPPGSVIDASQPAAWCPQGLGGPPLPFASPVTNTSENCLSLWIARPEGAKAGDKLPVILWLHGGGHALGSAYDTLYEPDDLIKTGREKGQPVIFVGINYRLGIFAFPKSKALQKVGHTNAALRDQRAAFDWVRKNIQFFGGDADSLTAIGHSVGGNDIGLHLVSHGGKGKAPFDRAIMMSGSPGYNFNIDNNVASDHTAQVARQAGCLGSGTIDSPAVIQCLRDAPFEVLNNASVQIMRAARPPYGESYFSPFVDGDFITDLPSKLLREGKVAKDVSVIGAWVANDGAWYHLPTVRTEDDIAASLRNWDINLDSTSLQTLLSLYPVSDFRRIVSEAGDGPNAQYFRVAQMDRDLRFVCPALDFTWHLARRNGVHSARLYEMNRTRFAPVFKAIGVPFWDVAHLSDVPYVFGLQSVGGGADNSVEQRAWSRAFASQVIDFAHGGKPNGWTPVYAGAEEALQQSVSATGSAADFPSTLSINLFGGPGGDGMVTVSQSQRPDTPNERAVAAEKLFARCAFINSAAMRRQLNL